MDGFIDNIRFAKEEDMPRLLEIYSPYVTDSIISFEYEVPSLQDFKQRFLQNYKTYPWLVYELEQTVVGYAYAGAFRQRRAYLWSCESTVYVDQAHHKKGIGKALYNQLFSLLKKQGFYNIFAGITLPNPGSVAIHTKMGFEKVGLSKNVGYKFSQWHDVAWLQKEINSGHDPQDPTPISEMFNGL